MTGPFIRAALFRAALIVAGIALAASAVRYMPLPGAIRAAGMLALPCVLFSVMKREERRLAKAAGRVRAQSVRPPFPAAPARPRR